MGKCKKYPPLSSPSFLPPLSSPFSASLPPCTSFCCVVLMPPSVSLFHWLGDATLLPAALLTKVDIIHFNIYRPSPSHSFHLSSSPFTRQSFHLLFSPPPSSPHLHSCIRHPSFLSSLATSSLTPHLQSTELETNKDSFSFQLVEC